MNYDLPNKEHRLPPTPIDGFMVGFMLGGTLIFICFMIAITQIYGCRL